MSMFSANQVSQSREDEKTYIVQMNGELLAETKALRAQLQETERKMAEQKALDANEIEKLTSEAEQSETSLRYLRNLQHTLASLHEDTRKMADGYKQCDKKSLLALQKEKHAGNTQHILGMLLLGVYCITVVCALFASSTTVIWIVTTSGLALVCADYVLHKTAPKAYSSASTDCTALRKRLETDEKAYSKAVDGIPGIHELIDAA